MDFRSKKRELVIVAHGGAGSKKAKQDQLDCIEEVVKAGFIILKEGGSSIDAVERTIMMMEDSRLFNAGSGSRLQLDGVARMDASIMEGKNLMAGAVASVSGLANPISCARLIMEKTPHLLLTGEGARRFGANQGLRRFKSRPSKEGLRAIKKRLESGGDLARLYKSIYGTETVGAVALDIEGNIAAGSSTGGFSPMLPGRVGDSPVIGGGTYADNRGCAVSMTGLGEKIVRSSVAKEISLFAELGDSIGVAAGKAIRRLLKRIDGRAGAIVLDRHGRYCMIHSTEYMIGGFMKGKKMVVADQFRMIL